MKGIKFFALSAAGSWVMMMLLSVIGSVAENSGLIPDLAAHAGLVLSIKIVFFSLFLIAAFSSAPLLIRLFIILTKRTTPDNLFVKKLEFHEFRVVCVIWLMWLAGLAMALPVALAECFFCSR